MFGLRLRLGPLGGEGGFGSHPAGKKQLFDDDGDYRDMLQSVAGVSSAADLDEAGRRKVIEHLKACGAEFRPARKSGLKRNPPPAPPGTKLQIRKIRAMLAEDGLPDAYAEAVLKQMCSHPHRRATPVGQ